MVSSRGFAKRYADRIKLTLSAQRYLTEPQERRLLLEAIDDFGLSRDEAREILAETIVQRRGARETTLDHDIGITIAAMVGDKGWISRTTFDHAAELYRHLSGGAISTVEAKSRVKKLLLRQSWKIRGEIIFGTPHWFRDIPIA
jgi:hypothetical protein